MPEPELGPEQFKPEGPEVAEKSKEVVEKPPEVRIETEEDVKELGHKTIEDTEKGTEEVITQENETLESAIKNIGADPNLVEQVKAATGLMPEFTKNQEEIMEHKENAVGAIKEVLGEKVVEELDFQKIQSRADQEIKDRLPQEENREITPEPEEKKAERMRRIRERLKEDLEKIPRFGKELEKDPDGVLDKTQKISPDNLAFIHATDYSPKIENGEPRIPTLFDNTNGDSLRTTTHFTVNHRVESHDWGNWDNKPYQIIMPGREMLEKNKDPATLNPVDTYWTKSTAIPEGSIIIYEESKKPDFPEELANKFHFIERKKDESDDEVISLVLEKAGITKIKGGRKKVEEPNFEEPYKRWASKEEIGIEDTHHLSWNDNLEKAGLKTKKGEYEEGIFYFMYSCKDMLEKAPKEVRDAAIDKFYQVFKAKGGDLNKIKKDIEACTYLRPGAKQDVIFETPESFSRAIERGKEQAEPYLLNIIKGRTIRVGDKSIELSEEERKEIIQRMPKETYEYLVSRKVFGKEEFKKNLEKLGAKYE